MKHAIDKKTGYSYMQYKFSELSARSQCRAVKDYMEGWNQAHDMTPNEFIRIEGAWDACFAGEHELAYDKYGSCVATSK